MFNKTSDRDPVDRIPKPQPEIQQFLTTVPISLCLNVIIFLSNETQHLRNAFPQTTVAECPDEFLHIKNIAVAEYIGDFPQNNMPHGNSKNIIGDYVRTSCAVKRKLDDMIPAKLTPRAVYEDMVLNNSDCAV